ncbi:MAG: hypothetical protein EBU08_12560 [Micrococcales bacterium]|nr:hypothetical protein [Micrococcales bacterium]
MHLSVFLALVTEVMLSIIIEAAQTGKSAQETYISVLNSCVKVASEAFVVYKVYDSEVHNYLRNLEPSSCLNLVMGVKSYGFLEVNAQLAVTRNAM